MLTDEQIETALIMGGQIALLAQAAEWLDKLAPSADSPADVATANAVAWLCAREVVRQIPAE